MDIDAKTRQGLIKVSPTKKQPPPPKTHTKKRSALLEVSKEADEPQPATSAQPADGAGWQPMHVNLTGPIAEGLMKCVIDGFPEEIRVKAAHYLALGAGAQRRELPRDLRSAASLQYMFYSLAESEAKSSNADLYRVAEGREISADGPNISPKKLEDLRRKDREDNYAYMWKLAEK